MALSPAYSLKDTPNQYKRNGGVSVASINSLRNKKQEISNEELFQLYRLTNDKRYRDRIIAANISTVTKVATSMYRPGFELEDLVQEGVIGFMKGIERFDLSKNTKLNSYCVFWVQKYIAEFIDVNKHPIHYMEKVRKAEKKARKEIELNEDLPIDQLEVFKEKSTAYYLSAIELSKPVVELDESHDTRADDQYSEDDEHEERMVQIATICEYIDMNTYRLVCAKYDSGVAFRAQCTVMRLSIPKGNEIVRKTLEKIKTIMQYTQPEPEAIAPLFVMPLKRNGQYLMSKQSYYEWTKGINAHGNYDPAVRNTWDCVKEECKFTEEKMPNGDVLLKM